MGNIKIGKSVGEMYKVEKVIETALPLGLLDDVAQHAVDFWLSREDLPDPNNRITVDTQGIEALRQAESDSGIWACIRAT